MLIPPGLECSFGLAKVSFLDVHLLCATSSHNYNICLVNDVFLQAVTTQRAFFCGIPIFVLSAITSCFLIGGRVEDSFVVAANVSFNVLGCGVTYF